MKPTRPALLAFAAVALTAWTASRARAADEESVPGTGTRVANGSRVTSAIGNSVRGEDDVDDYVFDGIAGQRLSASLRGRDGLSPLLTLLRPDGSEVFADDGARIRPGAAPRFPTPHDASASFRLDATGVWTLRVRSLHLTRPVVDQPTTPENEGDDPATPEVERRHAEFILSWPRTEGRYELSVKLGPAPPTVLKSVVPEADGALRFAVPGGGGGILDSRLTWRGAMPSFVSLRAPDGSEVPGFAATLWFTSQWVGTKGFVFPETLPLGTYELLFRVDEVWWTDRYSFRASLKRPRGPKALRGRLDAEEPLVMAVTPAVGGPGSVVDVTCVRAVDPRAERGAPTVLFGRFPAEDVELLDATTLRCRTPANLPVGTYDVVVESTSGQAAARAAAFVRLPPPHVLAVSPGVGSWKGGFDVTITGRDFNPSPSGVRIEFLDADDWDVRAVAPSPDPLGHSAGRIAFRMPTGGLAVPPGVYRVRVVDVRSGLSDLSAATIEISDEARIERILPALTPVLGGEEMSVVGMLFDEAAEVLLEDASGSDTYTSVATTFHDEGRLTFVAPARPKGTYRVRVRSVGRDSPPASYACFEFADLALGLPGGGDPWDATSSALCDFDGDGDEDLLLARALTGVDEKQSAPQTRVLANDGAGALTDATASVMPAVTADDDWRADRIACADVNEDGWLDLVLTTNSRTVPASTRSHTRILVNEPRGAVATDRVFRDRTSELMPLPRRMQPLYGVGPVTPDDWRGQDLWVGDLDPSSSGPPEIVVTHDETKEDVEVGCTPYCASPYSAGYTYSFYWGGSRTFVWDKRLRGGLGRYKLAHEFFPRKAGVVVQTFNPPPGITIPSCNSATPCRGTFTPFAGDRLAVGDLDGDLRPDVAVLASSATLASGESLATPLQVILNRSSLPSPWGVDITAGVPGASPGDAVAIGTTRFPDGAQSGVIALAQSRPPSNGSALRLWRYRPPVPPATAGDFEEITTSVLPDPLPADDALQASVLRFLDVDGDDDDDLVLVADAPPGGTAPALRVLRSGTDAVGGMPVPGVLRPAWRELAEAVRDATGDPLDGVALSIGDLDGDGALDFLLSRASAGPTGGGSGETRAVGISRR